MHNCQAYNKLGCSSKLEGHTRSQRPWGGQEEEDWDGQKDWPVCYVDDWAMHSTICLVRNVYPGIRLIYQCPETLLSTALTFKSTI